MKSSLTMKTSRMSSPTGPQSQVQTGSVLQVLMARTKRRKTSLESILLASGENGLVFCIAHAKLHVRDFLLKPELIRAISDLGFEHPSEGE